MEFNKYYREGWGLHKTTIEYMYNIIRNNDVKHILEFGSGGSTEFFIDARMELMKNYLVDSFDHNIDYAYNNTNNSFINVMIRDLIVCQDIDYDNIFKTKVFDKKFFTKTNDINNPCIKNATYNIQEHDLRDHYDLILIDGPNGNGRNFTYFYLTGRIKSGCYIVIDDFFHYDFLEKCKLFFDYDVIHEEKFIKDHPNKGHSIIRIK